MLSKSLQQLRLKIINGLNLFAIWENGELFFIDNNGKIRYTLVVDLPEAENICKELSPTLVLLV